MTEENFKKMDEKLMSALKTLREKEVSDGILKGFSTSVERRILAKKQSAASPRAASPAWAIPVFAVMILASWLVLRPIQTVEYAQLSENELEIAADIEALQELGVWDEADDSAIGVSEEMDAQELELSSDSGALNIA